jgi:hypothetical protein
VEKKRIAMLAMLAMHVFGLHHQHFTIGKACFSLKVYFSFVIVIRLGSKVVEIILGPYELSEIK